MISTLVCVYETASLNSLYISDWIFGLRLSFTDLTLCSVDAISVKRYGRNAGYGFVTFETEEAANKAVELTDSELDGRKLNVQIAVPRDENEPRRGRGRGRGGRGRGRGRLSNKPRREPSGIPSKTTLFVGNLPYNVIDQDLVNMFADYNVKSARVVRMFNGASRGFGFVECATEQDQGKALKNLEEIYCDDRKLIVRQAFEEDEDRKKAEKGHEITIKTEASA